MFYEGDNTSTALYVQRMHSDICFKPIKFFQNILLCFKSTAMHILKLLQSYRQKRTNCSKFCLLFFDTRRAESFQRQKQQST